MLTLNEALKIAGLPQKPEQLVEAKVDDVIAKLVSSTGGSAKAVRALFVGGGDTSTTFMNKLEKDGYDTSGGWEENKAWYKKHGITKAEFNALVKAGQ